MTDLDARPAQKVCVLCRWAPRDGTDVAGACAKCRGRHIADLADLPELFATLGNLLEPGAHGEQQRVRGKDPAPPAPVRMDVLNLRGPVAWDGGSPEVGTHCSIAGVMAWAGYRVRVVCGLTVPPHLTRLSVPARIDADVQVCTRHADTFAERAPATGLSATWRAVRQVRDRAWAACGYNAYRLQLGPCPKDVDGQPCGHTLWVDPVLDSEVRCRGCGQRWGRRYYLWLRRVNGNPEQV